MPSYKLMYFNMKGFVETSRLLFAYAGVEYEDFRFKDRQDFVNNYKQNLPTGRVPVLEIDGKHQYPDSAAIARFLAREFNLYGANNIEALQIDGVVETLNDVREALMPVFREQDETKKAELKKTALEEKIPATLTLLEKLCGGDVFVGSSISFADIAFFRMLEITLNYSATILDGFPKLKALYEKVAKEPKIAAWLAKRPDTQF